MSAAQAVTVEFSGLGRSFKFRGPAGVACRVENLRHVRPEEEAVIPYLPTGQTGRIVVLHPYTSPLLPGLLTALNPEAAVETVNLDMYDVAGLRQKLINFPQVANLCLADVEAAPATAEPVAQQALFVMRPGDSRDLIFDTLERLALVLPPGSRVLLCLPKGRAQDSHKAIVSCLVVQQTVHARGMLIITGKTRKEGKEWTPREARFEATTPTAKVQVVTRPGVFAHGRADAGGLALAESVDVTPGERILDIGCGCGMVGLLLADMMRQQDATPRGSVVLVDSNARAVACARRGVEFNQFPFVTAELSADFTPAQPDFDVVAANPPYYSDHSIAKFFVGVAARALKPGGRLYLVSKHSGIIDDFVTEQGMTVVETRKRRGYDITVATR